MDGLEQAAQVPVGEDAHQRPAVVEHRGHGEAFACHLQQRLREQGGARHLRYRVPGAHDVRDARQEAPAERSTRMRARVILVIEAAQLQEGDGECIAQRECCGRARGRGEIQRARLPLGAREEVHVGDPGE